PAEARGAEPAPHSRGRDRQAPRTHDRPARRAPARDCRAERGRRTRNRGSCMSELAIQMDGVDKAYRFFSLRDIRLAREPGQILGFVGPNGAGKSTTIRILMALVHQDEGDVRVLGRSMPREQAIAKRDIGYMSEDMRLYGGATLAWHMKFVASV